MKYFYFIFIFQFVFISRAQDTREVKTFFSHTEKISEQYYVLKKDKKIKHGQYYSFYENSRIKTIGNYSFGRKMGKWIDYDDEGNLLRIKTYENGQQVGFDIENICDNLIFRKISLENNDTSYQYSLSFHLLIDEKVFNENLILTIEIDDSCNLKLIDVNPKITASLISVIKEELNKIEMKIKDCNIGCKLKSMVMPIMIK